MENTAKESRELVWTWIYRALLVVISIIGFFIQDTLQQMKDRADEGIKDRKELHREIQVLKEEAAVNRERFIFIQESLRDIKGDITDIKTTNR